MIATSDSYRMMIDRIMLHLIVAQCCLTYIHAGIDNVVASVVMGGCTWIYACMEGGCDC